MENCAEKGDIRTLCVPPREREEREHEQELGLPFQLS
jgi:hypothetical protein